MSRSFKCPVSSGLGIKTTLGRTEQPVSIRSKLRYLDSSAAIRVDQQGTERHPGLAKEESWCQTQAEGPKGGMVFPEIARALASPEANDVVRGRVDQRGPKGIKTLHPPLFFHPLSGWKHLLLAAFSWNPQGRRHAGGTGQGRGRHRIIMKVQGQ